ncbi:hypothetical protein P692DRAFT_20750598, partial [Suillus brevipes Sb2]
TSQTSRHVPQSDLTASFFEFGEKRTAPTLPTLSNGPATGLLVSKFHIRAVLSKDPLTSCASSAEISMQVIL